MNMINLVHCYGLLERKISKTKSVDNLEYPLHSFILDK